MERLRKLKADLEEWFARLAPRERVMVSAAAVAVIVVVVMMGFARVQRGIRTREANIDRKTQVLAQVSGVTRAASLVHDERIGVGQVYHLFRLPEDLEQGVHQALYAAELCDQISTLISGRESAMAYLRQETASLAQKGVGPVHIGDAQKLRDSRSWSIAAALYAHGFENHSEIYPYFSDVK